jgi:hypothetical protein
MTTRYPQLQVLATEADALFTWAMEHGMPAPANVANLSGWAEASVQHAVAANAAARIFPQLVSYAYTTQVSPAPEFPAHQALPTWARFAKEYVTIAERLLDQYCPDEAQKAIDLACSMLNLARKAMDDCSRLKGPRMGGEARRDPDKPQILQEAQEMLLSGKSKQQVAGILAKKYNKRTGAVRDWLKSPRAKKTGER